MLLLFSYYWPFRSSLWLYSHNHTLSSQKTKEGHAPEGGSEHLNYFQAYRKRPSTTNLQHHQFQENFYLGSTFG